MSNRPPYTAYKLYVLCEPTEVDPGEAIRYVGISSDTRRRFKEHLESARTNYGGNPKLRAWLRRLNRRGLHPTMKVYHFEGTLEAMRRQEKAVIYQLRRQGAGLLNTQHNTRPRQWPLRPLPKGRPLTHAHLKRTVSGRVVAR